MSIFVITGGAGFLGARLAAHFGTAGHEVRVLDDFSSPGARDRATRLQKIARVSVTEGDVRDGDVCRAVCEGAEFILHYAARVPRRDRTGMTADYADVNIQGTIQMLEAAQAAKTLRRFVLASSFAVYGDTPAASKHEAGMVDPLTPYASSKLSAEYFCRSAYRLNGLPTVALRLFSVYGPDQFLASGYAEIERVVAAVLRRMPVSIDGDGEQSRDFLHTDDLIAANFQACTMQRGVAGKAINIGSGRSATLNQIIEMLERRLGRSLPKDVRPACPGEIRHARADVSAAAGLLQFAPTVSLDTGLARFLQEVSSST